MFTLGPGDFVPSSAGWGLLAPFATINGLLPLTLAVAFLVPVVSAVADKRAIAVQISVLGRTSAEILANARGERFAELGAALLATLQPVFFAVAETAPPPPPIDALAAAGLEPVDDDVFALRLLDLSRRRRALAGWVVADGWTWGDVHDTLVDHVASDDDPTS